MVSCCKVCDPSWTGVFQNRANVLMYISVRLSFCCAKSVLFSVQSMLSRCVHFCLMSCVLSLKLSEVTKVTKGFLWIVCIG